MPPSNREVVLDLIRQWRNTSWLAAETRLDGRDLATSSHKRVLGVPVQVRESKQSLAREGRKTLMRTGLLGGIDAEPFTPLRGMTGLAARVFHEVENAHNGGFPVSWRKTCPAEGAVCAPGLAGEGSPAGESHVAIGKLTDWLFRLILA